MNMTNIILSTTPEPENPVNEEIEVLDDGLGNNPEEPIPFFFGSKITSPTDNTIEEIKEPDPKEQIVDPVESIIKLDPNYEQKVEEEQGTDLKSAINEVRSLTESLTARGFNIELEELDLIDDYQINIKIKK